jgi:predicted dithiol-disulfide oxidoreductase (DUF899 family)
LRRLFLWRRPHGCLVHLEHDYHVSFTPEELAKGEVYYNYQMTDGGMEA